MAVKRMERYVELMEKMVAENEGQSGRAASLYPVADPEGGTQRKDMELVAGVCDETK